MRDMALVLSRWQDRRLSKHLLAVALGPADVNWNLKLYGYRKGVSYQLRWAVGRQCL